MTRERKNAAMAIAAGLVVMFAVPAAYRLWTHWNPPENDREWNTASEFLAIASLDYRVKLLKTPVSKWSETDKKSAPDVLAWLESQSSSILPWEWTEEAVSKDPKGYMNGVSRLMDGFRKTLGSRLSRMRKSENAARRDMEIARTLCAHAEEEARKISALTNAYPQRLERKTLSKGRFWGWNEKKEVVEVADETAKLSLAAEAGALVADIHRRIASQEAKSTAFVSAAKECEKAIAELDACLEKVVAQTESVPGRAFSPEADRDLCRCIVRSVSVLAAPISCASRPD